MHLLSASRQWSTFKNIFRQFPKVHAPRCYALMHFSCRASSVNKGLFLWELWNVQLLRPWRHDTNQYFCCLSECHITCPYQNTIGCFLLLFTVHLVKRQPCWFHLQEDWDQNSWESSTSSSRMKKKWQKCLQNTKILWMLNTIRTIRAALVAY